MTREAWPLKVQKIESRDMEKEDISHISKF